MSGNRADQSPETPAANSDHDEAAVVNDAVSAREPVVGDEGETEPSDSEEDNSGAADSEPPATDEPEESLDGGDEESVDDVEAISSTDVDVIETPLISVDIFGRTNVGQVREHNEDNFLLADLSREKRGEHDTLVEMDLAGEGILMAVCDGMGGAAAGEVASQMATDIIVKGMKSRAGHGQRDRLAVDVIKVLEQAGSQILAESTKNRSCRGMGTTATVAALVDDHVLLGQVGDSRAYLLRGEHLVQVTRDQSLVNQLIEAGQLTEEEAENFEHSNIILQALGTADAVQVDLTYVKLCRGDVLMLCSDGLSGMVRDLAIRKAMIEIADPEALTNDLIQRANDAGGHDNVTVIIAIFGGEGLEDPSEEDLDALAYRKYTLPAEFTRGGLLGGSDDEDTFDDTPLIEIHGEFEVPADVDWEELLGIKSASDQGAASDASNVLLGLIVIGLMLLIYLLFTR